ncbi:hypothetical protein GUJ93_ZPchr0006g44443 [Zizania palustris]|uniref:Uncharacterized protein n=1 Tax=Zizania palustris TaxID=103762 RepID=A0A8J5T0S8_ZIZPA|nr:hypothetical protein GUJ93_ZPchr0006g44443 [Zizania palustris]
MKRRKTRRSGASSVWTLDRLVLFVHQEGHDEIPGSRPTPLKASRPQQSVVKEHHALCINDTGVASFLGSNRSSTDVFHICTENTWSS